MNDTGTEQRGKAHTMATFKLTEIREAVAKLDDLTTMVKAARESAQDLTAEQRAYQQARALVSRARGVAESEGISAEASDALNVLAENVDAWVKGSPETFHVASLASVDRSEGDDVAEELSFMLRQREKGKVNNVPDDLATEVKDALDRWADSRPRRGGTRGSNGNASAGSGKLLPGRVLLTRNGDKVAEESSTVSSLAYAALKAHREARGADASDQSVKPTDDFKRGRKAAFDAIDKGDASAEWTDETGTYRLERV